MENKEAYYADTANEYGELAKKLLVVGEDVASIMSEWHDKGMPTGTGTKRARAGGAQAC